MQLTEHFSLDELTRSPTAIAQGIDNTAPTLLIPKLEAVCVHILEAVRAHYGVPVKVNSGYRCLALNRAVGGADDSQHVQAEAADFEVPGFGNDVVAAWVRDNLAFDQLILEAYHQGNPSSGWVHCSWTDRHALRHSVLTMTVREHGASYALGLHP